MQLDPIMYMNIGVVIFAGLFIHELGHVLVARYFGVYAKEVGIGVKTSLLNVSWTLYTYRGTKYVLNPIPLGAYVVFDGAGPIKFLSRRAQALILLSGSLANILSGLGMLVIFLVLVFLKVDVVSETVMWFVFLNVALGISNLLPLYPMDGSRVVLLYLPKHNVIQQGVKITGVAVFIICAVVVSVR